MSRHAVLPPPPLTEINAPATEDGFVGVEEPERTYVGEPVVAFHTARLPAPCAVHATPAPVPLTPGSKATPALPWVFDEVVPDADRFQSNEFVEALKDWILLAEFALLSHAAASTPFLSAKPLNPRWFDVDSEPNRDEYVGVTKPVAVGLVISIIEAVPVEFMNPAT